MILYKSFNIPFNKICFKKPNADFYIDDLRVNSFHDLEKELDIIKTVLNVVVFIV